MKSCLAPVILACLLVAAGPAKASSGLAFTIHAGDVRANEPLGRRHLNRDAGCAGENLSPELRWKDAPSRTRSYAVTVMDRDAPVSPGPYHWIVVNIPSRWTGLPRGIEPFSSSGGILQPRNDFGEPGWLGPCAEQGATPHRYVFTVYALDVAALPVTAGAEPSVTDALIRRHTIAIAAVTAIHPGWGASGNPGSSRSHPMR